MAKPKDFPFKRRILVRWFDAYIFNHDGWQDSEHIIEEFKDRSLQYNETVGYLLAETDDSILISGTVDDNGMIDYAIVIPRVNICNPIYDLATMPTGDED